MGKVGETEADAAESKDPEGAGGEVVCRPGGDGGFPGTGAEGTFGGGEMAEGGEDEVEGGRSGGFVDCAGCVGDRDAWERVRTRERRERRGDEPWAAHSRTSI